MDYIRSIHNNASSLPELSESFNSPRFVVSDNSEDEDKGQEIATCVFKVAKGVSKKCGRAVRYGRRRSVHAYHLITDTEDYTRAPVAVESRSTVPRARARRSKQEDEPPRQIHKSDVAHTPSPTTSNISAGRSHPERRVTSTVAQKEQPHPQPQEMQKPLPAPPPQPRPPPPPQRQPLPQPHTLPWLPLLPGSNLQPHPPLQQQATFQLTLPAMLPPMHQPLPQAPPPPPAPLPPQLPVILPPTPRHSVTIPSPPPPPPPPPPPHSPPVQIDRQVQYPSTSRLCNQQSKQPKKPYCSPCSPCDTCSSGSSKQDCDDDCLQWVSDQSSVLSDEKRHSCKPGRERKMMSKHDVEKAIYRKLFQLMACPEIPNMQSSSQRNGKCEDSKGCRSCRSQYQCQMAKCGDQREPESTCMDVLPTTQGRPCCTLAAKLQQHICAPVEPRCDEQCTTDNDKAKRPVPAKRKHCRGKDVGSRIPSWQATRVCCVQESLDNFQANGPCQGNMQRDFKTIQFSIHNTKKKCKPICLNVDVSQLIKVLQPKSEDRDQIQQSHRPCCDRMLQTTQSICSLGCCKNLQCSKVSISENCNQCTEHKFEGGCSPCKVPIRGNSCTSSRYETKTAKMKVTPCIEKCCECLQRKLSVTNQQQTSRCVNERIDVKNVMPCRVLRLLDECKNGVRCVPSKSSVHGQCIVSKDNRQAVKKDITACVHKCNLCLQKKMKTDGRPSRKAGAYEPNDLRKTLSDINHCGRDLTQVKNVYNASKQPFQTNSFYNESNNVNEGTSVDKPCHKNMPKTLQTRCRKESECISNTRHQAHEVREPLRMKVSCLSPIIADRFYHEGCIRESRDRLRDLNSSIEVTKCKVKNGMKRSKENVDLMGKEKYTKYKTCRKIPKTESDKTLENYNRWLKWSTFQNKTAVSFQNGLKRDIKASRSRTLNSLRSEKCTKNVDSYNYTTRVGTKSMCVLNKHSFPAKSKCINGVGEKRTLIFPEKESQVALTSAEFGNRRFGVDRETPCEGTRAFGFNRQRSATFTKNKLREFSNRRGAKCSIKDTDRSFIVLDENESRMKSSTSEESGVKCGVSGNDIAPGESNTSVQLTSLVLSSLSTQYNETTGVGKDMRETTNENKDSTLKNSETSKDTHSKHKTRNDVMIVSNPNAPESVSSLSHCDKMSIEDVTDISVSDRAMVYEGQQENDIKISTLPKAHFSGNDQALCTNHYSHVLDRVSENHGKCFSNDNVRLNGATSHNGEQSFVTDEKREPSDDERSQDVISTKEEESSLQHMSLGCNIASDFTNIQQCQRFEDDEWDAQSSLGQSMDSFDLTAPIVLLAPVIVGQSERFDESYTCDIFSKACNSFTCSPDSKDDERQPVQLDLLSRISGNQQCCDTSCGNIKREGSQNPDNEDTSILDHAMPCLNEVDARISATTVCHETQCKECPTYWPEIAPASDCCETISPNEHPYSQSVSNCPNKTREKCYSSYKCIQPPADSKPSIGSVTNEYASSAACVSEERWVRPHKEGPCFTCPREKPIVEKVKDGMLRQAYKYLFQRAAKSEKSAKTNYDTKACSNETRSEKACAEKARNNRTGVQNVRNDNACVEKARENKACDEKARSDNRSDDKEPCHKICVENARNERAYCEKALSDKECCNKARGEKARSDLARFEKACCDKARRYRQCRKKACLEKSCRVQTCSDAQCRRESIQSRDGCTRKNVKEKEGDDSTVYRTYIGEPCHACSRLKPVEEKVKDGLMQEFYKYLFKRAAKSEKHVNESAKSESCKEETCHDRMGSEETCTGEGRSCIVRNDNVRDEKVCCDSACNDEICHCKSSTNEKCGKSCSEETRDSSRSCSDETCHSKSCNDETCRGEACGYDARRDIGSSDNASRNDTCRQRSYREEACRQRACRERARRDKACLERASHDKACHDSECRDKTCSNTECRNKMCNGIASPDKRQCKDGTMKDKASKVKACDLTLSNITLSSDSDQYDRMDITDTTPKGCAKDMERGGPNSDKCHCVSHRSSKPHSSVGRSASHEEIKCSPKTPRSENNCSDKKESAPKHKTFNKTPHAECTRTCPDTIESITCCESNTTSAHPKAPVPTDCPKRRERSSSRYTGCSVNRELQYTETPERKQPRTRTKSYKNTTRNYQCEEKRTCMNSRMNRCIEDGSCRPPYRYASINDRNSCKDSDKKYDDWENINRRGKSVCFSSGKVLNRHGCGHRYAPKAPECFVRKRGTKILNDECDKVKTPGKKETPFKPRESSVDPCECVQLISNRGNCKFDCNRINRFMATQSKVASCKECGGKSCENCGRCRDLCLPLCTCLCRKKQIDNYCDLFTQNRCVISDELSNHCTTRPICYTHCEGNSTLKNYPFDFCGNWIGMDGLRKNPSSQDSYSVHSFSCCCHDKSFLRNVCCDNFKYKKFASKSNSSYGNDTKEFFKSIRQRCRTLRSVLASSALQARSKAAMKKANSVMNFSSVKKRRKTPSTV